MYVNGKDSKGTFFTIFGNKTFFSFIDYSESNGKIKFASSLSSYVTTVRMTVRMTVVATLKSKGNMEFITILERTDFPFISVLAQTPQLKDTAT